MAKKIEVTAEVREALKKEFEISNEQTIYNALNFESDSPSAKMIRRRALELGGREWMTADEIAGCMNCEVRNYPPCDKRIPCCKCENMDCNGRQPCPMVPEE